MLIAGEASGDLLGAEVVTALREQAGHPPEPWGTDPQPLRAGLAPRFIGAGGPRMAAAGVDLAFDMTAHAVIGISAVLRNYLKFRRLFHQLLTLARQRQPEAIVCIDFAGFNRRFGHAVKAYARAHRDWFHDWDPKLIQFVSPQVWASREGRADKMARDFDLLLSLFPFEKEWYARRVPSFPVEFIGHPMIDRFTAGAPDQAALARRAPRLLLLPGSRPAELTAHLPVMLEALRRVQAALPGAQSRMVLPSAALVELARSFHPPAELDLRLGGLSDSLREADLALASTGTVIMECAFFGVPTVALYKTSWLTYEIGKRIVKIKYLAMPNLLADAPLLPEFIQHAATAENLAGALLGLWNDPDRRAQVKAGLAAVVASLGGPGATGRAARAILRTGRP